MTPPPYWNEATSYLSNQDPILARLIAAYPDETWRQHHNPFATLVKAIAGQQISVKAAAAICQRLESLLGEFTPQHYLAATEVELRQCGLSRPKIRYLTQIAQAFGNGKLTPNDWSTMSDEAIAQQLISLPGIGTWTAQMFQIFYLHRPDILPLGDAGLLKALQLHYSKGEKLNPTQIKDISQSWQPYRTVATWYLWRSLDPHPVQY